MASTIFIGLLTMFLWELIRFAIAAARTKRAPLSGYYWQPVYNPLDPSLSTLWSLELVEVRQRGRTLTGNMYRVYGGHWQRSWAFSGWVSKDDAINLSYHSNGEDEGEDGTIRLPSAAAPLLERRDARDSRHPSGTRKGDRTVGWLDHPPGWRGLL